MIRAVMGNVQVIGPEMLDALSAQARSAPRQRRNLSLHAREDEPCNTLVALETGTVFFEAKAGPYRPLIPAEKAAWAPAEGSEPVALPGRGHGH